MYDATNSFYQYRTGSHSDSSSIIFGIPSWTGNSRLVTGHVNMPCNKWTFIKMWYKALRNSSSSANSCDRAGGRVGIPISVAAYGTQNRNKSVSQLKTHMVERKIVEWSENGNATTRIVRTLTRADHSSVGKTPLTKAIWPSVMGSELSSTRTSAAVIQSGKPLPLASAELFFMVLCVNSLMTTHNSQSFWRKEKDFNTLERLLDVQV